MKNAFHFSEIGNLYAPILIEDYQIMKMEPTWFWNLLLKTILLFNENSALKIPELWCFSAHLPFIFKSWKENCAPRGRWYWRFIPLIKLLVKIELRPLQNRILSSKKNFAPMINSLINYKNIIDSLFGILFYSVYKMVPLLLR